MNSLWLMLTHNADGTPSSTKFWQAVAYITATGIMIWLTMHGAMTSDYLLIYIGALAASRSFQNYLVSKGNRDKGDKPNV